MSVRTMARVWELSQHSGTDLLMLLAIADFADDQGNAYPSVTTLAEKCRMKQRNAQVILGALRASGELDVRPNEGPRGTNLYRVTLASQGMQSAAPLQRSAPLHSNAQGGAKECAEGVQHSAPEPSLNHQEPPVGARRPSAGQAFKTWYESTKTKNPEIFEKTDPVFAYLDKVGLSESFFLVAWHWFKQKHLDSTKRQKDWPKTFQNYVRNNYGRLWFLDKDQVWKLTSTGKQVAIEHDLDPDIRSGTGASNRGESFV
jgi:hypothetical protein